MPKHEYARVLLGTSKELDEVLHQTLLNDCALHDRCTKAYPTAHHHRAAEARNERGNFLRRSVMSWNNDCATLCMRREARGYLRTTFAKVGNRLSVSIAASALCSANATTVRVGVAAPDTLTFLPYRAHR